MTKVNIKAIKIKLRNNLKKQRQDLTPIKKSSMDNKIKEKFSTLWQYQKCKLLLIYMSKDIEVDTIGIIEDALKSGKKVAVPICIPEKCLMDFYYINSIDEDLEEGCYGVLEPIVEKCKKVEDFSNSVCIVPGLSFDHDGYRLGYGKGYYDRFLSGYNQVKVGLCYSMCVKPNLPHGYYDRPVDFLITEKYFRKINAITRIESN